MKPTASQEGLGDPHASLPAPDSIEKVRLELEKRKVVAEEEKVKLERKKEGYFRVAITLLATGLPPIVSAFLVAFIGWQQVCVSRNLARSAELQGRAAKLQADAGDLAAKTASNPAVLNASSTSNQEVFCPLMRPSFRFSKENNLELWKGDELQQFQTFKTQT